MVSLIALVGSIALQGPFPSDSVLRLSLRVHLLRSAESPALTTTLADSDVHTYLATANAIWQQAGIRWELESVVHEDAPNGALFERLIAGQAPGHVFSFLPRGQLLTPGWNLFLIQDFGRIGGGMFLPEVEGVLLAQRGFGFELPPDGRGGATLAHELGHSLGLKHEQCDATRNIMANGCWNPAARSSLTPEQIALARTQAAVARPTTTVPTR
jgi:hypothetical protein